MHTQGELFQARLRTTYPTLLETQHLGFIQISEREAWGGITDLGPLDILQAIRT